MSTQDQIAAVLREALEKDFAYYFSDERGGSSGDPEYMAECLALAVSKIPGLTIVKPNECFNPSHYELPEMPT